MNRLGTALIATILIASGASFAQTLMNGQSVYGAQTQPDSFTRTVDLSQNKSINVDCGDVVTFVNGDKQFTWKFDSTRHSGVPLASIAPADFGATGEIVYVDRNETEAGG